MSSSFALAAAAAAVCRACCPHLRWQLQLQPFVVRVVLVHVAAAAVAVIGSGPPSRVLSERGDGGLVGGKSNEIYPLRLAFRVREGLGTCVVATVGRFVAALDTMGVRRDEEGFTPPRHIENGV